MSDLPSDAPLAIRAVLDQSAAMLHAVSPSARLDAEVLLAHTLNQNRAFLRAWPEAVLAPAQRATYARLLAARHAGTPIAYLIGSKEFWSREFSVSPAVLIPRPETELLIECVLARSAEFATACLLDLATGSGAIAVTLAAELPASAVYASDISEPALAIARRNAVRHEVGRIRFLQSDWLERVPQDLRFDLIVSNPPYVADSDPHLSQGDVAAEPALALRAGPDGLDAYRNICDQARARLVCGGWLLMEHGCQQGPAIEQLLTHFGYRAITGYCDLQGHRRAIGAVWPGD